MLTRDQSLDRVRKAWQDGSLVLFLGAGVSIPHGIPNWNDLVLELLLEETTQFSDFAPHYRSALGQWMATSFDFTPVTLSRVFKNRLIDRKGSALFQDKYLDRIRKALYRKPQTAAPTHDTLAAVAEVIAVSEAAGRKIRAVVTSNFDDLLEQRLAAAGIEAAPVFDSRRRSGVKLPILHVHGYLPQKGKIPEQTIVFAEDEYHQLTYSFFHWALAELVNVMRNATILFVGFSMNDPNIRRLLDATNSPSPDPCHFTFRKDYTLNGQQELSALNTISNRAKEIDQSAQIKKPTTVMSEIKVVLDQAQKFDSRMLEEMGVGVIWINTYDEIPQLLRTIPPPQQPARPHSKRARR